MNIQIVNTSAKTYSNIGRYFFAEMIAGKHHASFAFGPMGVRVCVHNAANRCWKGLGKQFATVEAAVANYKTGEIRSMIQEAARMSQEAA